MAICRQSGNGAIDVLVLGDGQVATPEACLRDERIAEFGTRHRSQYRSRLRAGSGFDDEHAHHLSQLQMEQSKHRNRPDGYWIAEADPRAAEHSITASFDPSIAPWSVLASDGVYRPLENLGNPDWFEIASRDAAGLEALLLECETSEERDHSGRAMPRAKRHDDKSVAVVRFESSWR